VQVDPFEPREFRTLSGQAGIRQLLATGAQAEYSYRVQQIQQSTPQGGQPVVSPYYLNELQLKLTQPLLRDFGTDVNRARITISRNNRRVSLLEFRNTLEKQLFETERLYWQLVQSEREVGIQQDLLDRSLETYQILYNRFIANLDVSRIQVSQAKTFVEAQRAVLVRAKSRVAAISDQLKQRMNDPDFPAAGPVVILPADSPIVDPIDFQLQELIDTALDFRPELGQQILRIRTAEITQEVARNNLLPQLNFTGSLSIQGVGLNVGQALKDQRQWDDLSSSIGLELEVPIGNRAARAIYRRVELQRYQAIEQFHGLVDTAEVEVKSALREVNTTWDEIVQRRQSRFAAQDTLLGIQQRVEADEPLTPEFVQLQLDAQERLARAAADEAAAVAAYNTAIAQLEQAKGTLLRYNNVVMAEEPLPNPPPGLTRK
jgi:outer membrane protein TolC